MSEQTLIAIVEDDVEIRSLMTGLLVREGYEAAPCSGGAELDRLLERRRVDLVLLDLMMPGEDGLSICRRLRGTLDIPILIVTAKSEDIDRVIGLELGADDYLAKPFNSRELFSRGCDCGSISSAIPIRRSAPAAIWTRCRSCSRTRCSSRAKPPAAKPVTRSPT